MTEDFQRVRHLFEAALDRRPAERQAFLDGACDGHPALRAEVERMLAADAQTHAFIDAERRGTPTVENATPACPSCGAALLASPKFCPECGSPLAADGVEGRFRAGALFANRFRIVAGLGRGGMGEVYRAHDLELGQPVALKFLTALRSDERARQRLRNEVRLARQLAHPNVCRVYDIGEAHGELYLSMEYVDGEDLASLLKRIGRLPVDKGVEIARKLCAGLAAAHAKGVLHRDFKPANIMIDASGEVRVMDFGLAAVSTELEAKDIRSGTPAYMAPEQLAGREATVQSDLYALGLVLYELFTGKAPFDARDPDELQRQRESHPSTTPATLIPELPSRVEQAILHCLEPDPKLRPASALDVSASLPGGDPLAEALAAGETPSPGVVAASGPTGAVRLRAAIAVLALTAIGLGLAVYMAPKAQIAGRIPLRYSPEVLIERARDIVRSLGYSDTAADAAAGFQNEDGWIETVTSSMSRASREAWGARLSVAPFPISFWYRQSEILLERPSSMAEAALRAMPRPRAIGTAGEVMVDLDLEGALLAFRASSRPGAATPGSGDGVDWSALFAAARIDVSQFMPTEPSPIPRGTADTRVAWHGPYRSSAQPVRVEAGAVNGAPSYFEVVLPWSTSVHSSNPSLDPSRPTAFHEIVFQNVVGFLIAVAAILLARYNWMHGRGDVRGAGIIFLYLLSALLASTVLGAQRISFRDQSSVALSISVGAALMYLALEPWVRRMWPQALITWSRVLAGRWRDPVVARDVAIGVLAAVGINCLRHALYLWASPVGAPAAPHVYVGGLARFTLDQLMGTRFVASAALYCVGGGLALSLTMFLVFFLARALCRNAWLGAVVYIAFLSAALGAATLPLLAAGGWIEIIVQTTVNVVTVLVMLRFGLLALAVWATFGWFIEHSLLTYQFGAWYGESSLAAVVIISLTALWAFRTSLGGRPVLAASWAGREA